MKDELLQDILLREFPDSEIVTLSSLTKKIAIVSKVRVSNQRDYSAYDEVSLYNIDEYGVIYIPDRAKQQAPANYNYIKKQALNYGDLLLNQRTAKMRVGFVGRDYKRTIVGNNSMIRIEFEKDSIDTAKYVQLYLQLPYVLEYLNGLMTCSSTRRILSSAQLGVLPIPKYEDKNQLVSLTTLLYPRMKLIAQAKLMQENAQKLIKKYEQHKLDAITVNFNKELESSLLLEDSKEVEIFKEFEMFYSRLL